MNTYVCFRVNLHLRHRIIKFHILLPNRPTILDDLDALAQLIGRNGAAFNGGFGHKCDGCLGDERLCCSWSAAEREKNEKGDCSYGKHWAHYDGFNGRYGGIGITLYEMSVWLRTYSELADT